MLPIRYILLFILLFFMGSIAAASDKIRIGLTPVFVEHQSAFIKQFQTYLGEALNQEVEFVQRASYQGVTQLLLDGKIDAAWICGYPYVKNQHQLDLVAAPIFQGQPLYKSYIIVPSSDTTSQSLADLKDKIFAFSDPDSNSGHLYPSFLIWLTGESETTFFKKAFFTGSHNNVVDAVASGLANGGAVDGYVWESLKKTHPELVNKTRIIERSENFGFPPIVARKTLEPKIKNALTKAFLEMNQQDEGRMILSTLNLDGFMKIEAQLYNDIEGMMFVLEKTNATLSTEQP